MGIASVVGDLTFTFKTEACLNEAAAEPLIKTTGTSDLLCAHVQREGLKEIKKHLYGGRKWTTTT